MKKVLIIGASGSLASYVIDALQSLENTTLTLFVRKKKRLEKRFRENFVIIEGDATDFTAVKEAVTGQDIVYVNLAGELEKMGEVIIKAMQDAGVKRIIVINSMGIYNPQMLSKHPVLYSYRKLADMVEESGLTYTILRPNWFTSKNEVDYVLTSKGEPETGTAVSRKSIATFIADIIRNPGKHTNENLGISKL